MRRALIAGLVAAATAVPPAGAAPDEPMRMTASGGAQDGNLSYYTTSRRHGDLCSVGHADGTGAAPDPVTHDGSALVWRIPDARKPLKVVASKGHYVPVLGTVTSNALGSELAVTARPVRRGGRVVAWEAVSEPVGSGDLTIRLYVSWKGSCAVDEAARVYRVLSLDG